MSVVAKRGGDGVATRGIPSIRRGGAPRSSRRVSVRSSSASSRHFAVSPLPTRASGSCCYNIYARTCLRLQYLYTGESIRARFLAVHRIVKARARVISFPCVLPTGGPPRVPEAISDAKHSPFPFSPFFLPFARSPTHESARAQGKNA